MVITTYKGYVINYDVTFKKFNTPEDAANQMFNTQEELEKRIDTLIRETKKDFKRIPCYGISNCKPLYGEVTSFDAKTNTGWVTYEGGYRTKIEFNTTWHKLYKNSDNNKVILQTIKENSDKIQELEKYNISLISKLERLTISDVNY